MDKNVKQLVSSDMMLGLREVSEQLDIPVENELKLSGIDPELLDKPEGFIYMSDFINFLNATALKYECPDLGLRIAECRPKTRFGVLTLLLHVSPDVGTALRNGHRFIRLFTETTEWDLEINSAIARIIRNNRYNFSDDLTQLHILSIAQYIELLIAFMGRTWHASAIYFTHSAPEITHYYEKIFRCPIKFEQSFDGFEFQARDLKTPIASSDALLFNTVLKHLESLEQEKVSDDICQQIRMFIRRHLCTRVCNLQGASTYLGLHPKSLQRVLKANNLTFKKMLVETRYEVACYYLEHSSLPLKKIAYMVGYSDASSFTRAFIKYCGISPIKWRSNYQYSSKN